MLFFCFTHYWLYSWKGTNSRMDGGDEWVPLDVQRLIDWLPDQKSWTNSLKKYVIKKKTQHVENAHFNNENTKPQWNILVENLKVLKWIRPYLCTIPTLNSHFNSHLNSHFNSHLNSHFLLSKSGNSFLKNSHFSKKNSHFYLIRSGNSSGN